MSKIVRAVVVAGVGLALAGCGSAAENLTERAIEEAGGGQVDVEMDEDGGSFSVQGEDGEGSYQVSGDGSMPDDWPEDIPLPDGQVMGSSSFSDDNGEFLGLQLRVESSPEETIATVEGGLQDAGWEEQSRFEQDSGVTVQYVKDQNRAVSISVSEAEGGASLSVTVTSANR